MSRGPGRVQRRVIAVLEAMDAYVDTITIAAKVYNIVPEAHRSEPNLKFVDILDYQIGIIRRALDRLARQGKVFRFDTRIDHRVWWSRTIKPTGKDGDWITHDGFAVHLDGSVETLASRKAMALWRRNHMRYLKDEYDNGPLIFPPDIENESDAA
jgi:hypothetical protein